MFWDRPLRLRELDLTAIEQARSRAGELLMPLRAMGRCHEVVERLAAIQGTAMPHVDRPGLLLAAGDHGIVAEGVTAYPSAVTRTMVEVFLRGGGTCNALVRAVEGRMAVINAGVAEPIGASPTAPEVVLWVDQPVRLGTRNFLREPALTPEETAQAVELGYETARRLIRNHGLDVLAVGEMGIGNTTVASVLTAWLTGAPVEAVVGPGADLPAERLDRKRIVVYQALKRWADRVRTVRDALTYWGGLEVCAMVGAFLACGTEGVAGLVDGFISTAAAACAVQLMPGLETFLIACHESAEPGHGILLRWLGWEPLLRWGMRLGEGTGALMAIPLLRLATELHRRVWTFSQVGLTR
ncbi:MAG: nicotinate-nucleotide--dimethylbenzimidazole phosphoribosyltransferase [Acidobacteria bacterium]|nr:nicotinate-nucleotide--dimethylbenzimidazole phosphoribosyltransferase [Acidobacteriota bacterium]MDW7984041.1 nicotinate-nucleotide--dimethylbenzimidazole phosphoribosyltransferase [Acidobacteriota bacterium]